MNVNGLVRKCVPPRITTLTARLGFVRRACATARRARSNVANGPSLPSVAGSGNRPDQVSRPLGDTKKELLISDVFGFIKIPRMLTIDSLTTGVVRSRARERVVRAAGPSAVPPPHGGGYSSPTNALQSTPVTHGHFEKPRS